MISVIVPIYNVEAYLPHCIESILNQTYTNFELLLIDDGSTDSSGIICDSYCKLDGRCRAVHQTNQGEFGARNRGLKEAVGEYIAFIDADDYVHQQYLEILYKAILENRYDIAVADAECVPDLYHKTNRIDDSVRYSVISQTELIKGLFSTVEFMVVWGKLYKRNLLEDQYFINKHIALDIEYNSRVYQSAIHIVHVEAKLYHWVCRPTSVTRNFFSQRNIDAIDCYLRALENLPKCKSQFRAFGLQRLYKVVLYTRYNAPANFKAAVMSKAKPIISQTHSEFMHNRHIPLIQKLSLMTFWYIPSLYALFRQRMEQRAKA